MDDPLHGVLESAALKASREHILVASASLRLADPDRPITPDEYRALLLGEPLPHVSSADELSRRAWALRAESEGDRAL